MTKSRYPRDLRGYGNTIPKVKWPGNAKIAIQFVVNYEEGGENNILHGDAASEAFLSEVVGALPWLGQRHWNMETIYEYGARAGFWRLWRIFQKFAMPVTVYGVATALQRSPEQVQAMKEADWEIASHGLKWIEYKDFSPAEEKKHILETVKIHTAATGESPRGWYTGRCSINTVNLLTEMGSFDYLSDSYADDLPYWHRYKDNDQLIIPYALDTNDMRFATAQGFNSGDQFFNYLKDSFDVLYKEGKEGAPKLLNIGLHCRLVGRPGRVAALVRFLEYLKKFDDIWVARRIDIAEHWKKNHPPMHADLVPSTMGRKNFVAKFGGIFEESEWIAERTFKTELGRVHDTSLGLHSAMVFQFRLADEKDKLKVLKAHPILAPLSKKISKLTPSSKSEQSSAGLSSLTTKERESFARRNKSYRKRFGFPFIIAVTGMTKQQILREFDRRLKNDRNTEFEIACREVEKIAKIRLEKLLP